MVGVGVVGAVLFVVFVVAETRENGVIDGVYTGFAVVTLFVTVLIELFLANRRNRARDARKLPD